MNGPELKRGDRVDDRYVLKEFLGSGSFGEVWLAEDEVLGIDIAVKLYLILDESGQEEFKEEYKITSNLNHQNLLTTNFYSVWGHRPFLTMKYCSHGSASSLGGNIDEQEIWKFIRDVANGLSYLHKQEPPIIHQDIKPANILVDDQGTYLITDFGISKKLRSTMRKQSKRKVEQGAIAYMGPERFLAEPMTVKASDIWSLGVSIFELATNELPFMGQGGGMLNYGAALPKLDPKRFSANLNDVMQRCLKKDTWERPTAEQLAAYADYVIKGGDLPFEKWVKNGGNPTPVPVWKKALKIAGISALSVLVILLIIGFLADDDQEAERIHQHYTNLSAMCASDISNGSAQNLSSLIEAGNLLDSLRWYRTEYSALFEKSVNNVDSLSAMLDRKLSEAQAAWLRTAKAQISVPDYGPAIEYLHNVMLLGDNSEAQRELSQLAGTYASANMIVKDATVNGDILNIKYDGLNMSGDSASQLVVVYTIFSGYDTESGIKGQATLPLTSGKDNSVSIRINGTPAEGQNHVHLAEKDAIFYKNY